MNSLSRLVFRQLTQSDYFNINKPVGIETGGGGQSYIDISTNEVTLENWYDFFSGMSVSKEKDGPAWTFPIRSLGVTEPAQSLTIAQRRGTSVSIRAQKLLSKQSNRVYAWHPDHTDFPKPINPEIREEPPNLRIYIARLDDNTYWAGWTDVENPKENWPIDIELQSVFEKSGGYLKFGNDMGFDEKDKAWPFRPSGQTYKSIAKSEIEKNEENNQEKTLFDEDIDLPNNVPAEVKVGVRKIRLRNQKAVNDLKKLYGGLCQLTGDRFVFKKVDGSYYCEAHHLIPLGKGGADSVYNIVVISPLIHRMLHYAKVEGLNLSMISENRLSIKINGAPYTISWHPRHAEVVKSHSLSSTS